MKRCRADAEVIVPRVDFPSLVEETDAGLSAEHACLAERAAVNRRGYHNRLAWKHVGADSEVDAEVGVVAVAYHPRADPRTHLHVLLLDKKIRHAYIAQGCLVRAAARQALVDVAPI